MLKGRLRQQNKEKCPGQYYLYFQCTSDDMITYCISFSFNTSLVNVETADLVTFTEEILNGKLHFSMQWLFLECGYFLRLLKDCFSYKRHLSFVKARLRANAYTCRNISCHKCLFCILTLWHITSQATETENIYYLFIYHWKKIYIAFDKIN